MSAVVTREKKLLVPELVVVTTILLVVARTLFLLRTHPIIGPNLSLIVACLFLYVPIMVLWLRRRPVDFLDRSIGAYLRSFAVFAVAALICFPPFFVAARVWYAVVFGMQWKGLAGFPAWWNIAAFQILLISLPEEFFFRGYFQSAMDRLFAKRWPVLGSRLGWGWVITAAVFAFAHSIVLYKWWHFSIFFPALLFGYLRERTGSITAPIFFHAASNFFMDWFVKCYY